MADSLFKNKGIDTQYEREKINYKPKIDYKKRYRPPTDSYIPPEELTIEKSFYLADFNRRSEVVRSRLIDLKSIIEERLKDDVVVVDHDVYLEAKDYDINQITFQEYQASLNKASAINDIMAQYEDHLRTYIYEDYHATSLDGKIEVEVYRDLLGILDDMGIFIGFVYSASSMTPAEIGDITSDDIKAIEDAKFEKWEDADRRRIKYESEIRAKLNLDINEPINFGNLNDEQWQAIEFEYRELERANSDLRRFSTDPINKIKRMAKKKLDSWSKYANTLEPLLFKTPHDFLNGSIKCLILNVIQARKLGIHLDKKDFEEVRRIITNIRNATIAIEKLSKVALLDKNQRLEVIKAKMLSLFEGVITSLINEITMTTMRLKNEASESVLDWLNEASRLPNAECWAFDTVANTMLDAIESVDNKITNNLRELYKVVTMHNQLVDQKISVLNDKQVNRHSVKAIVMARQIAEMLLESLDKFTYEDIEKQVDNLIKENGWNRTFDRIRGQVIEVGG